MLHLKKYLGRIKFLGTGDIQPLRDMLPAYGQVGIDSVLGLLTNPNLPELSRVNALLVLGSELTQLPTGRPYIMATLESLAEFAPPDIDLMCFVGVYANGVKGRPEAVALVNRFKVGTDRQRALFLNTDREFMRGLAVREVVKRYEANHKNG